jgi:HAD superfamily 5'-nucleotidase-like hydrolase
MTFNTPPFARASSSKASSDTTPFSLESLGLTDLVQPSKSDERRAIPHIHTNRDLPFASLSSIGFDLDYTLAQYTSHSFANLAYEGSRKKLVSVLGYPKHLLTLDFKEENTIRGLIIDTLKGNIIKVDTHKYVRIAYHGNQMISSRDRKNIYVESFFNKVDSYNEPGYVKVDTIFQFVDVELFSALIDMKDGVHDQHVSKKEQAFLDSKTYEVR